MYAPVFPRFPSPKCGVVISEAIMPYATGEVPLVGDYVKNRFEQPGTVLVAITPGGNDLVSVRWDDGGSDSPITPAAEFSLIARHG